ncbi:medium-chain acyl-CoA ligase ACSF2, mitochondrial-like [Branchiostoma lanceolatum]|uniref:medium-chain acyl-CoA ligase ACSF2, mitochondrial-like n=1 Tax=Branchiostoma lanceolatum TaxID=7740 RepID=UPI00345119CA
MTCAEVKREADRLAAGLLSIGVGRGDVVAWVVSTRPEWIALGFAVAKIGAVALPLIPLYFWSSYDDIVSKVMAKVKVKVFLIENFPATEDFEGTLSFLKRAFPETTSQKTRGLTFDTMPSLKSIVIVGDKNHEDAFYNLKDIQSLGDDDTARGRVQEAQSHSDCHDAVMLVLTSASSLFGDASGPEPLVKYWVLGWKNSKYSTHVIPRELVFDNTLFLLFVNT